MDSFGTQESNLSREIEGGSTADHHYSNLFGATRKKPNNPFLNDTVSEINDDKEKNAIFNHSLKHGVFNDIRNSPLKERLPTDLQYYNPALEKRLFAQEFQK